MVERGGDVDAVNRAELAAVPRRLPIPEVHIRGSLPQSRLPFRLRGGRAAETGVREHLRLDQERRLLGIMFPVQSQNLVALPAVSFGQKRLQPGLVEIERFLIRTDG
jgi:hypothetical protein